MKQRPFWQKVGIDIIGGLLVLLAIPIGWIPGPGGIAVLILGLSLLATNHEWAERLMTRVKDHGVNISQKLFSNDPRIKWLLDIASVAFIAGAVLIVTFATQSLTKTAAISLVIAALFLFFGNRKRFHNLRRKFTPKRKH